jgi:hypothetical protein
MADPRSRDLAEESQARAGALARAAEAFLFNLISRLQFSGTVPMIDVQAYGRRLRVYALRCPLCELTRSTAATDGPPLCGVLSMAVFSAPRPPSHAHETRLN